MFGPAVGVLSGHGKTQLTFEPLKGHENEWECKWLARHTEVFGSSSCSWSRTSWSTSKTGDSDISWVFLVLPFLFTANCWRGIIPGWAQKTLQLHPGLCHVGCCSPGLLPSIQELQDITCLQNNHENMIVLIGMVVRYLSYIYPLYKSLYLIWLSWYHINITIW